jgi:GAF domain-containing protein
VPISSTEDRVIAASIGARPELRAMLTVSRAVAQGGPLHELLDRIASEAAGVVEGADRSSIILIEGSDHRFRLAASHGLSDTYRRSLATGEAKLTPGQGPSGVAYTTGAPVVISDLADDPRMAAWVGQEIAREERYRAIVSLPLRASGTIVGTLNVYRTEPGRWSESQVEVLTFFAEHAAGAVETAQLLDQRNQQLGALRRIVRTLRQQTHEHANRLHVIGGLLALGEIDQAKHFLDVIESSHAAIRTALDARIHVPTVAGLVLAEAVIAGQRDIRLTLAPDSCLRALPAALSETQLVTIVGNLLDNAFDAVANAPAGRREVVLRLDDRDGMLLIEVTDSGVGLPDGIGAEIFRSGVTHKRDHQGIGLSLVAETVRAALGAVQALPGDGTTTFRATIPA